MNDRDRDISATHSAIWAAYEAQVCKLYGVLVASLTHEEQERALTGFKRGLVIARRARDLALNTLNGQQEAA